MNMLAKIGWIGLLGALSLAACCKSTTGFANPRATESLPILAPGSTAAASFGALRTP